MVFGSGNKFRIRRSQSSYRREPRDREKGLPNFEGSYKRTMSPSPSCTNLTNGFMNGSCPKDIENVDPKSRTCSELSPMTTTTTTTVTNLASNCTAIVNAKYEDGRHLAMAVSIPTATAVTKPVAPVVVRCASHIGYRERYQNTTTNTNTSSPNPPHLEQSTTIVELPSATNNREYSSKLLPKNATGAIIDNENGLAEPTKQRSCRTPRTQSDPSSVKDASLSTANFSASHSSTNLQKIGSDDSPPLSSVVVCGIPRSQSNLSNVDSTESGYSSLSLNVPSPSISPTRLSSTSSSSSCYSSASGHNTNANVTSTSVITSWSYGTSTQCDMTNETATCPTLRCDLTHGRTNETVAKHTVDNVDKECSKYSQKSEIVLRISAITSDAASQTECSAEGDNKEKEKNEGTARMIDTVLVKAMPAACCWHDDNGSTSPIFKQKSQEEIDCERLACELVSHLSNNDQLYKILAPKTSIKRSTDYLINLFKTTMVPHSEYSSCSTQSDDQTRLQNQNTISKNEPSYRNETTSQHHDDKMCDNDQRIQPLTLHEMRQKMDELINRLDHRINMLKAEETDIAEECRLNDTFGETITEKVCKVVSTQEAAKYKLHIQEIGQITSLLLGLSKRLAKVENSLYELSTDNQTEKKSLESKRDKLACQLEEAKMLKANIDKRGFAVSTSLIKHFTDEEIAEYEYFVHMKSKLLIDGREVADKIENGERQLAALKNGIDDEKFERRRV